MNTLGKCKECKISLGFKIGEVPANQAGIDFKNVPVRENAILDQILASPHHKTIGAKFIILVDGSRYGIEIIGKSNNCVLLKQHFLHYDGKRGKLVPVSVRFVMMYF